MKKCNKSGRRFRVGRRGGLRPSKGGDHRGREGRRHTGIHLESHDTTALGEGNATTKEATGRASDGDPDHHNRRNNNKNTRTRTTRNKKRKEITKPNHTTEWIQEWLAPITQLNDGITVSHSENFARTARAESRQRLAATANPTRAVHTATEFAVTKGAPPSRT